MSFLGESLSNHWNASCYYCCFGILIHFEMNIHQRATFVPVVMWACVSFSWLWQLQSTGPGSEGLAIYMLGYTPYTPLQFRPRWCLLAQATWSSPAPDQRVLRPSWVSAMPARCISVTSNALDCDQIGLSNTRDCTQTTSNAQFTAEHCFTQCAEVGIGSLMHCNKSKWGDKDLALLAKPCLAYSTLCQNEPNFVSKTRVKIHPNMCQLKLTLFLATLTKPGSWETKIAKISSSVISLWERSGAGLLNYSPAASK